MNSSIEAIFQPIVPFTVKVSYLNATLCGHTFTSESDHVRELISKITELIIPPSTRCEGLSLLEVSLKQCPLLYAESKWCSPLLSTIRGQDSAVCKELACKCLIPIIENQSRVATESSKKHHHVAYVVVTEIISKVEAIDGWLLYALKVIDVCMKKFPSILSDLRDDLCSFLCKLMNCLQSETVEAIAECFARLPSCSEQKAGLYGELWSIQVSKIINTLSYLHDFFCAFYDSDEMKVYKEEDVLQMPLSSDDPAPNIVARTQQFQMLCKCMAKMLSLHTRCEVTVPVGDIINFLCRLFMFPEELSNPRSIEERTLCTIYPVLQNSALIVLEAIILNFSLDMMLSAQYMVQLLQELFTATKINPVTKHNISQLRCSIWRILDIWVVQHSIKSLLPIVQEPILKELRYEISIRDLSSEVVTAAKNGKAPLDIYSAKTSLGQWTESSCGEALQVLTDLVFVVAPALTEKALKGLLQDIIKILTRIQAGKEFPFPYESAENRRKLYSLLLSFVIADGPTKSLALKTSIGIFNRGKKDPSLKVIRVCQHAVAHCKNILRPRKPILDTPVESTRSEEEGWGRTGWNLQYAFMADNPLHQDISMSEPIQVASTYHGSDEAELHNKDYIPVVESFSSGPYFDRENQINGEDNVLHKFADWKQAEHEDSDEEDIVEAKNFKDIEKNSVEKKTFSEPSSDVQEMEVDHHSLNEQSNAEELHMAEKNQSAKGPNENICQNGVLILSDEEMPSSSLQKTENGECSLSSSEENSEEEDGEEGEAEEEYEEAESFEDSPMKKGPDCSEDMESEDGVTPVNEAEDAIPVDHAEEQPEGESDSKTDMPQLVEDEKIPTSPSLKEMCSTFVLCEAKDAS